MVSRIAVFWLLFIIVFAFSVYAVRDILLPFVAGLALAYFLDPLADKLEDRGMGRLTATALLTLVFTLVLVAIGVMVVPLVVDQAIGFIQLVPGWANQLADFALSLEDRVPLVEALGVNANGDPLIPERYVAQIQLQLEKMAEGAIASVGTLLESLWAQGAAFFNFLALMVIMPVVAFYMLRDWDNMVAMIDSWLPTKHADVIRAQVRHMEVALSGFVRGQSMVCAFLGTFYAVGLTVVGLDFGLLIGIIAGILAFIPYVGTFVGLVASTGMAIVQWWGVDPFSIVLVLAIFGAGQMIEGLFLTPRLVGDQVGLHPVWVMFALLAGGNLFGFVGVLLAVPVAAVIAVLIRYSLERYLESEFYHGSDSGYVGFTRPQMPVQPPVPGTPKPDPDMNRDTDV